MVPRLLCVSCGLARRGGLGCVLVLGNQTGGKDRPEL